MRLSIIVKRLKEAHTRFGDYVAGSAELDLALRNTLKKDMAFVVPIADDSPSNLYDSGESQLITERFSVIIALANDVSDKDKTGLTSYDQLHDIRSELFRALVGWQILGAESLIYYAGGKFITVQNDYLWWQYDFEYKSRITEFDGYCDIIEQTDFSQRKQVSQLDSFDKISSKYILWPGKDLPWQGTVSEITSDLTQMETWIDLTEDPNAGPYDRGFGSGFDFYRILNRRNDPK